MCGRGGEGRRGEGGRGGGEEGCVWEERGRGVGGEREGGLQRRCRVCVWKRETGEGERERFTLQNSL